MQKLIKLSDEHYIGIDDSEKPAIDDWIIDIKNPKLLRQIKTNHLLEDLYKTEKKITHSTQPLELSGSVDPRPIVFNKIKPLSLSEVEEAIYGYSVEKMAKQDYQQYNLTPHHGDGSKQDYYDCFTRGFKAHQELVKDKLFTIEDMQLAIQQAFLSGLERLEDFDKVEKMILENVFFPTEWNVEIDEQGKIKLIN